MKDNLLQKGGLEEIENCKGLYVYICEYITENKQGVMIIYAHNATEASSIAMHDSKVSMLNPKLKIIELIPSAYPSIVYEY